MDERDVSETRRLQELYMRRMGARKAGGPAAHVTPEAILAVVLREGAEADRLATLEHVMSCAACHREYEWLKAVNQAGVEHAGRAGQASAGRPWWQDRKLALAAALVMAVGAALAVRSGINPGAERVRGNPGDIALVAPAERAASDTSPAFAWRAAPGATRYVLEIQRSDGSVAIADTTVDTTATLAGRLPPAGDYRWWVREVTDGSEPRSSAYRELRIGRR